ncbi:hypothetical protein [Moraxella lacunata]|uniref:hypothetical protein n=1 Tax=Moraxella lacunata TaxID=477 RepID=UPI003EDFEB16
MPESRSVKVSNMMSSKKLIEKFGLFYAKFKNYAIIIAYFIPIFMIKGWLCSFYT